MESTTSTRSGFEAMGHPIPVERQSNALKTVQEMCPDWSTEKAMDLVGKVAHQLEQDEPYGAQKAAMERNLDLTGTYRLFAVLLTGGES